LEERVMKLSTLALAVCVAAISTGAFAKVKSVSLRDQQQAACYDDVMKLCKDAVPDEDKVTACMQDKKPVVSPKCAAMWDVD
jgi:uncharacterized protein (UPF0264 family)